MVSGGRGVEGRGRLGMASSGKAVAQLGAGLHETLDAERAIAPHELYEVGSMLSYDERLLLHWAARTGATGAILDLGSFVGGSTLALAAGAQHRGAVVHAYDRFVLAGPSQRTWLPDGFALSVGDSTRAVFEHNTASVRDRIIVHEGDVQQQAWQGPIGVLFVDIAKSWATADAVWRTFLPAVTPGALVIQQDLVHWAHPWCAVVMEHLGEHFEYLGWVWYSSAVYRCRTPIEDVPVPMLERFSCDEMLALVDRAAARVGEPAAGSVRLSGAFVFATFGRLGDARARVAEIAAAYDDQTLPHIEEGFAFFGWWLDEVAAGRSALGQ